MHWLIIEREPVLFYSAVAIVGSLVIGYIVFWNTLRIIGDDLSIRADSSGVESSSIIGRRSIKWTSVSHVSLHKSTIFLHPNESGGQRAVPLGTILTNVSSEEVQAALLRYRPEFFGDVLK